MTSGGKRASGGILEVVGDDRGDNEFGESDFESKISEESRELEPPLVTSFSPVIPVG